MAAPSTLTEAACAVLNQSDPIKKATLSHLYAKAWREGILSSIGTTPAPDRPARSPRPELLSPRDMPKRKMGSRRGKIAMFHAIAHIELNAIDIAWDAVARFGVREDLACAFCDDWVSVADDEATHFQLLVDRLADFNTAYGDLPAHNGLWETAAKTAHDPMLRMALMPMLFEARGLDTTPATIERLHLQGDDKSTSILARIANDEIRHVAAGIRWFEALAGNRNLQPIDTFKTLILENTVNVLKPPFNREARDAAGMDPAYYNWADNQNLGNVDPRVIA